MPAPTPAPAPAQPKQNPRPHAPPPPPIIKPAPDPFNPEWPQTRPLPEPKA